MTMHLDHPHDRLRDAMHNLARIENARLYGRDSAVAFYAHIRAALSHTPITVMQIAEHATCSPATARRYADMLVDEGVAVRLIARGNNGHGGLAYFYALRLGVVA